MKAFGTYFQVDDPTIACLQTYDAGMASIFHIPTEDAWELLINYVGNLKVILKLDYRSLQTPVILMKCEWMKRFDNWGNHTYKRDEAGFLVVNFYQSFKGWPILISFQVRLFKSFSLMFQINQVGRWFYEKRPTPNARW